MFVLFLALDLWVRRALAGKEPDARPHGTASRAGLKEAAVGALCGLVLGGGGTVHEVVHGLYSASARLAEEPSTSRISQSPSQAPEPCA
mgnify:CR=1 FL=1